MFVCDQGVVTAEDTLGGPGLCRAIQLARLTTTRITLCMISCMVEITYKKFLLVISVFVVLLMFFAVVLLFIFLLSFCC